MVSSSTRKVKGGHSRVVTARVWLDGDSVRSGNAAAAASWELLVSFRYVPRRRRGTLLALWAGVRRCLRVDPNQDCVRILLSGGERRGCVRRRRWDCAARRVLSYGGDGDRFVRRGVQSVWSAALRRGASRQIGLGVRAGILRRRRSMRRVQRLHLPVSRVRRVRPAPVRHDELHRQAGYRLSGGSSEGGRLRPAEMRRGVSVTVSLRRSLTAP